jgi:hypothetical protein
VCLIVCASGRYLSYSAPHDPLQADAEYVAKCHDVPNRKRREFCGMMAQLDHGIANVTEVRGGRGTGEAVGDLCVGDSLVPFFWVGRLVVVILREEVAWKAHRARGVAPLGVLSGGG